jgi:PPE family protein
MTGGNEFGKYNAFDVTLGQDRVLNQTGNWAGYSHQQLWDAVHNNTDPSRAYQAGAAWMSLGDTMGSDSTDLQNGVAASASGWRGQAADAARAALTQLSSWGQLAGVTSNVIGQTAHNQADIVATAQRSMPEPVNVDSNQIMQQAFASQGVAGLVTGLNDVKQQVDAANSAKQQAVDVMNTMEASSRNVDNGLAVFEAPPKVTAAQSAPAVAAPRIPATSALRPNARTAPSSTIPAGSTVPSSTSPNGATQSPMRTAPAGTIPNTGPGVTSPSGYPTTTMPTGSTGPNSTSPSTGPYTGSPYAGTDPTSGMPDPGIGATVPQGSTSPQGYLPQPFSPTGINPNPITGDPTYTSPYGGPGGTTNPTNPNPITGLPYGTGPGPGEPNGTGPNYRIPNSTIGPGGEDSRYPTFGNNPTGSDPNDPFSSKTGSLTNDPADNPRGIGGGSSLNDNGAAAAEKELNALKSGGGAGGLGGAAEEGVGGWKGNVGQALSGEGGGMSGAGAASGVEEGGAGAPVGEEGAPATGAPAAPGASGSSGTGSARGGKGDPDKERKSASYVRGDDELFHTPDADRLPPSVIGQLADKKKPAKPQS